MRKLKTTEEILKSVGFESPLLARSVAEVVKAAQRDALECAAEKMWQTVRTEKDLPNEKHLYDEEIKYCVRVYHDDRGSHIEELTEDEIWEAAEKEDGAVCWLREKIY